jgi:hypothetical protein
MSNKDESAGPTWAQYVGQTVRPLSCGCTVTVVDEKATTVGCMRNPWTVQLCPTHAAVRPLPGKLPSGSTPMVWYADHLRSLAKALDRFEKPLGRRHQLSLLEFVRRCQDSVRQAQTTPALLHQLLANVAFLTSQLLEVPKAWDDMHLLVKAVEP